MCEPGKPCPEAEDKMTLNLSSKSAFIIRSLFESNIPAIKENAKRPDSNPRTLEAAQLVETAYVEFMDACGQAAFEQIFKMLLSEEPVSPSSTEGVGHLSGH